MLRRLLPLALLTVTCLVAAPSRAAVSAHLEIAGWSGPFHAPGTSVRISASLAGHEEALAGAGVLTIETAGSGERVPLHSVTARQDTSNEWAVTAEGVGPDGCAVRVETRGTRATRISTVRSPTPACASPREPLDAAGSTLVARRALWRLAGRATVATSEGNVTLSLDAVTAEVDGATPLLWLDNASAGGVGSGTIAREGEGEIPFRILCAKVHPESPDPSIDRYDALALAGDGSTFTLVIRNDRFDDDSCNGCLVDEVLVQRGIGVPREIGGCPLALSDHLRTVTAGGFAVSML